MAVSKSRGRTAKIEKKLQDAIGILKELGFAAGQSNERAAYVLLALLDLPPLKSWAAVANPLRGTTPVMEFLAKSYDKNYRPNTRETIHDEALKYFVDAGLLLRNPDKPDRATNSAKTVYQIEPSALALMRTYGTPAWTKQIKKYLASQQKLRADLLRDRNIPRIPVKLSSGKKISLSPGGQNPLIKLVVEEFCSRFAAGAKVVYIGDAENKFLHLDASYLEGIGVVIAAAAKMPDVVVHDTKRNWLLLIEAVVSAGSVDAKRRKELKQLFRGSHAGLVFVTAFFDRQAFGRFQQQISWETEVWIANEPDHVIHFNGVRFLGPYPDAMPAGDV
jgi:hypothetical protein